MEKIGEFIEKSILNQDAEIVTGFMARSLVQATMPHSKPQENYFVRKNGSYTLSMQGHPTYGIPYGTIPRLLMSWITTEAVRKKSKEIELGHSLNQFMGALGFTSTGGKNGSITSLKDQMKRLFTCSISCIQDSETHFKTKNFMPIHKADLWWDVKKPDQNSLYMSTLTLSEDFFNEIIASPVVFRLGSLKLLKQSSMAIDIYIWLTYRNSYAKKPSWIKWEQLQEQFGAGFPTDTQGKRNFKKKFIATLKKVAIVYPEAGKLRPEKDYLIYVPGMPDIPKLKIIK